MLVEDESLIALLLEDMLMELGYDVVGPYASLEKALKTAHEAQLDAAVLDVNINGGETFLVAEVLAARGIPFMFSTGYNRARLPARFRAAAVLQKPYRLLDLKKIFAQVLSHAVGAEGA